MKINKGETRPKKRKVFLVILTVLMLYVIGKYWIPRFPFGPYKLYNNLSNEQQSEIIPYAKLTDETSYPFVSSNDKRDYKGAISRFPNVTDCLIQSEQKKASPDLRLINWDKIRNVEDADVCVWRIFTSFHSSARARQWLTFHDAHIVEMSINTLGGEWGARMPADIPYPTRGCKYFTRNWASPGMFIRTTWGENGKLKSVYWRWQDPL